MSARAFRRWLGRLLPYPLIRFGRRVVHFGLRRCRVCEGHIRRKLDSGFGYPVLEELRVVGGKMRRSDKCPLCHSSARERLVWLWLTHRYPAFANPQMPHVIAHFAPEKGLSLRLAERFDQGYRAYDLDPSRYRHLAQISQQDLSALTLDKDSVDLVLCNHVIEHVFDVALVLSELHRVLRPDGIAILQVPLSLSLGEMRDGGRYKSAGERIALYGQDDHLRLYTPAAWREALESAGFAVETWRAFDEDSAMAQEWELDPLEALYLARPI